MIEGYLRQIDELLSTSPAVSSSVRDTGVEKVLNEGDRVISHPALNGLEILQCILAEIEARGGTREA